MEALVIRFLFSLLTSAAMAIRALRRKSVDLSGVLAGIPVMIVHMMAGYRYSILFFCFSIKFEFFRFFFSFLIGGYALKVCGSFACFLFYFVEAHQGWRGEEATH